MTNPMPIQHLEPRRLLASFATLDGGTLTLTGTKRSESFFLLERSGKLRVSRDNVEVRFKVSSVTKVIASLNAGNDSFVMNSAISIPATVFGGSGNDTIFTARGSDRIEAGAGDDLADCGYGSDRIYGDAGFDALSYQSSSQRVRGTLEPFSDRFNGGSAESKGTVARSGERDRHFDFEKVVGSRFGDDLELAPEQNLVPHSPPIYEIEGGDGNDHLHTKNIGGGYYDRSIPCRLAGGNGNDLIVFGTGTGVQLTISGGDGDDTFSSDVTSMPAPGISVSGGSGIDEHNLGMAEPGGTTYSLPPDIERLRIPATFTPGWAFRGNELDNQIIIGTYGAIIYGAGGNDTIYGGDYSDTLYGDAGDDLIYGGDGADRLYGGNGNDTLDGQGGRDHIYGNAGTDRGRKQKTDRTFDSIEILL